MYSVFFKLNFTFLMLIFMNLQWISADPSCTYPPCHYNINRRSEDLTPINVDDHSTHSINWQWDVRGGRWNVTYKLSEGGFYEGSAVFKNYSTNVNDRKQAFVSWSNTKDWESSAIPVYANPWNITYNGDIFGFVPTRNGHYIFRIYSRNKRHNPFADEDLIVAPASPCSLISSDITQIQKWWALRKSQRNCPQAIITHKWNGKYGRWHIVYFWDAQIDITASDVFYKFNNNGKEYRLIHLELDERKKSVFFITNPVKIYDEKSWTFTLYDSESIGFQPSGNDNKWAFHYFSRNLVFHPFQNAAGRFVLQ